MPQLEMRCPITTTKTAVTRPGLNHDKMYICAGIQLVLISIFLFDLKGFYITIMAFKLCTDTGDMSGMDMYTRGRFHFNLDVEARGLSSL